MIGSGVARPGDTIARMLNVIVGALGAFCSPQQDAAPVDSVRVQLEPASADAPGGPRWSPKGAKVELVQVDGVLEGSFELGPKGAPAVAVRLSKSGGAEHFDELWLDADRDGAVDDAERLQATPKEQRGKWWSSFSGEVAIAVPADAAGAVSETRPYPLALWFVFDPREPDAEPVLRWSRRGWHSGRAAIDGRDVLVQISEAVMDGVFDQRDAWALGADAAALSAASSRRLEQHVWLDGVAYRATAIDPHGRELTFEPFDPGFTEAEERKASDRYAADRAAARAEVPLAFGTDLAAALQRAKKESRRVLLDFETTWCGPCKLMNQLVYTAKPVVDAAADIVAVKLDGDEARDAVERYRVTAYPTILLLGPDGAEIRRAVGYRGVAEMVELLRR